MLTFITIRITIKSPWPPSLPVNPTCNKPRGEIMHGLASFQNNAPKYRLPSHAPRESSHSIFAQNIFPPRSQRQPRTSLHPPIPSPRPRPPPLPFPPCPHPPKQHTHRRNFAPSPSPQTCGRNCARPRPVNRQPTPNIFWHIFPETTEHLAADGERMLSLRPLFMALLLLFLDQGINLDWDLPFMALRSLRRLLD